MRSRKNLLKLFLIFIFLALTNVILYKILSPRVNAFGCFDDCFNIVAGHFILQGKILYSQIWFNHQMLMADISFIIQTITHPSSIYELILRHRQFIFAIAFILDFLIIYRFGLAGIGFTLFYEFSKFYIFGDRFLGESLVVYFFVFNIGILWLKLNKNKLKALDYIIAGFFTWLIIFLREPYTLAGIATYFFILWDKNDIKYKITSLLIFSVPTAMVLLLTPIKDYIYQVLIINSTLIYNIRLKNDSPFIPINDLKILFYPFYLYLDGEINMFRYFIVSLNTFFIITTFFYIKISRKINTILIFLLILGLANLRPVTPGTIFYSAFHMLPWYGAFIFLLFLLLSEIKNRMKKFYLFTVFALVFIFSFLILSPGSYVREKINPQEELITNYGNILQIGEVVRHLSNKNNTLFLDGADDLIYWQANLLSSYRYSWYTSFMPIFPTYQKARTEMFNDNPPDFYYAFCTKGNPISTLPKNIESKYQVLYSFGKPTCLYIKKSIISGISAKKWASAKEFKYYLR